MYHPQTPKRTEKAAEKGPHCCVRAVTHPGTDWTGQVCYRVDPFRPSWSILVPKQSLGTPSGKLCFPSGPPAAKQSFAEPVPKQSLGTRTKKRSPVSLFCKARSRSL